MKAKEKGKREKRVSQGWTTLSPLHVPVRFPQRSLTMGRSASIRCCTLQGRTEKLFIAFLFLFLLGNDEYISPLVWKCTEASFSTIWIDSYSTFLYIIHTAAFRRPSPHVLSLDGDPDSFCRFLLGEKRVNNRVNKKNGRPTFYEAFTLFLSTHQCVTMHSCHDSFLYTKLIPHHFKQSLNMVDTCNPGQKWAD